METSSKKEYRKLIIANWVFTLLTLFGISTMILKATEIGVIYLFIFIVFVFLSYTIPAILLSSGINVILGIPILISNKLIYKISFAVNIIFAFLGIVIVVMTFYEAQYIAGISGFLYFFLSYFNIKALNSKIKELN